MSLTTIGHLLLAGAYLPLIFGEVFQGCDKDPPETRIYSANHHSMNTYTDDCPRHFRRCNEECLDNTTNHTKPCHTGPWGKCLSAHFPFYCNVTDTCIGKDELCGDHCFDGNPGSFWYDHTNYDKAGEYGRRENLWKLEDGVYDEMFSRGIGWALSYIHSCEDRFRVGLPGSAGRWLQRYNCDGKCITYKELCKGGCNHPDYVMKWGKPMDLQKCGSKCLEDRKMDGYHNCGDECLTVNVPCNGTCADATVYLTGPQSVCGNECRPRGRRGSWKECPDGTCRGNSVNCEGPLPGSCPEGQLICRYFSMTRGIDYSCRSSSQVYLCNENENKEIDLWSVILSPQNHPADSCYEYSQPCRGECMPGYVKCYDKKSKTSTCKHSTEYINCGDECKESKYYSLCNGECIFGQMCNGVCAKGYKKCGENCIDITERYDDRVDCNGICQSPRLLCDGKCLKSGWSKALTKHYKLDIDELTCKPNSDLDDEYRYHECNGIFLDNETPCNGTCGVPGRELCRGVCVTRGDSWNCDGECISKKEHCNGKCYRRGHVPCGRKCVNKKELDSGRLHAQPCGDRCITTYSYGNPEEYVCNGECSDGKVACGEKCYTWEEAERKSHDFGQPECVMDECRDGKVLCGGSCYTEEQMKTRYKCGDECLATWNARPCEGKCPENLPFKCMGPGKRGEICLEEKSVGDGEENCGDGFDEICFQQWSCNGAMQCINKPCHPQDHNQNNNQPICQSQVNKTFYDRFDRTVKHLGMYYCAADDECKLDYIPCDGVCMVEMSPAYGPPIKPRSLFACEDGSKCIGKRKVCDGKKDCEDGSDEICRCNGDINCPERLWYDINDKREKTQFRCENVEESIRLSKYCDGTEDCSDGSDEQCANCPGIRRCRDGNYVCGNIPCDNTGLEHIRAPKLDDLTCEREGYDLCEMGNGDAKCVKRAIDGQEDGWWSDKKAEDGEPCNDHCFAGVKCGNKCLAKFEKWYPTCNGNCEHINSSKTMVTCDGYCWEEEELIKDSKIPYKEGYHNTDWHTVNCEGECRMFGNKEQRIKASRRPCNGTCLENWIACTSGDQCYNEVEWCNGVAECEDGSDEANCDLCPSIIRCESTPQVNHTSSNGPKFPEFVCPSEPCGTYCSPNTHPCGNVCISNNQLCSLTNQCRSYWGSLPFFKCDKCLDVELVCDGKQDCQDGSDEDNCIGYKGSWFCNTQMQSKTKPCSVALSPPSTLPPPS